MTRVILLLIFCVLMSCIFFVLYLNRHRFAFKSTYGVSPQKAKQEIIDEEITGLREAAASYENKDIFVLTEVDRDCLGGIRYRIDQAIMLAKKYGFHVPLEQK